MNNFFDKVFVINMKRSSDRLQYMRNHLASRGIEWSRFEAVDGNKLDNQEIKQEIGFLCQTFCTPGMIGCALSHKRIWEKVLEENLNNALIMEDDIIISNDYENILSQSMSELPCDWDVLLLGCGGLCNNKNKSTDVSSFIFGLIQPYKNHKKLKLSEKQNQNSIHIFIPEFPTGFYCYAVSKKGCEKLLNISNKIHYHIDYQVATEFDKINIYAINPKLVKPRVGKSTINEINFPKSFNCILDKIEDSNGIPYSWYMNLTLFQWFGIPFNIWSIIFIVLGMGIKKYGQIRELIILIFLLELIRFDKSLIYNLIYVILGHMFSFMLF